MYNGFSSLDTGSVNYVLRRYQSGVVRQNGANERNVNVRSYLMGCMSDRVADDKLTSDITTRNFGTSAVISKQPFYLEQYDSPHNLLTDVKQ
jgi:hypothetical protein